MTIEITVPELGESIHDVRVTRWFKTEGEQVHKDEDLVEIESEKATVILPAPEAGRLTKALVAAGQEAQVGQVIGRIDAATGGKKSADGAPKSQESSRDVRKSPVPDNAVDGSPLAPAEQSPPPIAAHGEPAAAGPDARRALRQFGLSEQEVAAEAAGTRLTRADVERFAHRRATSHAEPQSAPAPPPQATSAPARPAPSELVERPEEIVPMSPLRQRIAARLVEAQHQAALLTTVNEIDMSAVVAARQKYGEQFQKQHDVRLGFMSFFVEAAVDALRQFPELNAEVRGTNIVYKKYYDIGIAVGTERGLVVPVVRSADQLSMSEIERTIAELARRAREGKLLPADLTGGTFTITNGGTYGSLLSTPIVNPPQTAILGLHAIQDRPVAVEGQVVVRPMMYAALTYDHRVVDGSEAVSFLRRIKERIEDPLRKLFDI